MSGRSALGPAAATYSICGQRTRWPRWVHGLLDELVMQWLISEESKMDFNQ
ncbi:hypothetical protein SCP_1800510 [Sparassis crispa]|uniref:Uncharacterized protein n=1 Tax=Sparassis crispa TaxID=139825 RepID=A0A401H6L8_9APHY|nr:hypothetical protein SCP_1800510 [Sparassis crispa]GBE90029.1 hypothetical protein SCP_1800510 [Sparassis crispa]